MSTAELAMSKNTLIILLMLMATLAPFAIDIFIPALPIMANGLHTSIENMHWSITLYLLSLGIGQLFLGPLADKIGRRPLIVGGLLLYVFCSICLFSINNFELHLMARFFQGIGACSIGVCMFACIRDSFDPKESSHLYNYLLGIRCLSPTLAPTFGHLLSVSFGWHSTFAFLAFMGGFTLLIALFFFKETRPETTITPKSLLPIKQYFAIGKQPTFLFNTLILTLSMAFIFSYVSSSPIWLMEHLGLSQAQFTFWFSLNAVINVFTNLFLPKLLLKRFPARTLIHYGLLQMILAGALAATLSKFETPISYMIPIILGTTAFSILVGICVSQALHLHSNNAGTASALLSFCQVAIGAMIVVILHQLNLNAVEQLIAITSGFIPLYFVFISKKTLEQV